MKKLINPHAAKEVVKEKADLLQIIKEDIGEHEWRPEGSNTWVTHSPFRDEGTPSFKVSGKKWKDWGGEQYGGDVLYWVQLWHGLRFEEAILHVADRCSIDIVQFLRDPTPEELQVSRYKQINSEAADYMHEVLRQNINVRDNYLNSSGFTLDMIAPYQVGYCSSVELLVGHLTNKFRMTEDEIHKLEFDRRDLFNDVLVYPVHNHSGEVIHFRTRKLNPPDSPYIGVRAEHPLHDLSVIYGFFEAKKNIRRNGGQLVIVEGQRDTIALKAGGVLGAALRDKQIEALKQYKIRKLIICYDSDETGWKNTLELVSDPPDFGDMLVTIARPDWVTSELDVDPHDIWRSGGDEAVYAMLKKAVLPIEYYITAKYGKPGTISPTDQKVILSDLKEYLNKLSGVDLDMVAAFLATVVGSTQEHVLDYVSEIKAAYSQLFNLESERVLLFYCMTNPVSYNAAIAASISRDAFTLSSYQKLFDACGIAYTKFGGTYSAQNVLDEAMAKFAQPEIPAAVSIIMGGNYKYTEPASCQTVLDMYKRRKASEQASKLITASRDLSKTFPEIIAEHRKTMIDSVSSSRPQARLPRELADEFYELMKDRQRSGGNLIIGADCHRLPVFNLALGGIQKGQYTVIAGETSSGKSAMAMNILECIAVNGLKGKDKRDIPTLWIGQEMHSNSNTGRLISIMTGIHNKRLVAGNITANEALQVAIAKERLANSGYYSAKPRDGTIEEIVATIDEYRFKYGIEIVIWDYIQLVVKSNNQSRASREEIIGNASKIIVNRVVGDMGLGAVILAQLNRADKSMGSAQRVGGSYQISQDCDNFIEIIKKNKKQIAEDGEQNGNRYIFFDKQRSGVSGFRINANLDTEVGGATLRLEERVPPSEFAQIYAQMSPGMS